MSRFISKDVHSACNVSEARQMLQKLAAKPLKNSIPDLAHKLGWDEVRTRNIYQGRARRVDAHEMDGLRQEYERVRAKADGLMRMLEATYPGLSRADIVARCRQVADLGVAAGAGNGKG